MTSSEKKILKEAAALIRWELQNGRDIGIHGFGKFTVKDSTARNPRTQEKIQTKRIGFKPSSVLKDAVKAGA